MFRYFCVLPCILAYGVLTVCKHLGQREQSVQSVQSVQSSSTLPPGTPGKIWILVNLLDKECIPSVEKVFAYLETKMSPLLIEVVDENDLTMRIDTNGLSLYHHDTLITADEMPKVVWCRLNSARIQVDQHVTLLRHLELMGATVVNSIEGIMKCTNKVWHLQELAANGIPLPTTLTYTHSLKPISIIDDTLTYPLVMKAVRGNGGKGVFLVPNAELQDELSYVLKQDFPYLYQEYIKESHGTDIRVIVVDGKPVFSMIRQSSNSGFRANLSQGGNATISTGQIPEAEALAVKIATILKLSICGVDLLFGNGTGTYVCCEVNNNPGFSKPIYDTPHGQGIPQAIGDYLYKKSLKY